MMYTMTFFQVQFLQISSMPRLIQEIN